MDPSVNIPPLNIPSLLRTYNLSPRKSLGQNFLTEPAYLERITAAAEIHPDSEVLEVGPGLGSLTRYLAASARKVVIVELDAHFLPVLAETLQTRFSNIAIHHGDILKINPDVLMEHDGYLVVANIPYYITSALIRHLFESNRKPSRMVLTIQREVAERICSKPGDLSLLALGVQVYGEPKILFSIPPQAFYPSPKVDSSVLRVDLFSEPVISSELIPLFFTLAKAGFKQKRKTLRNSLSAGLGIPPQHVAAFLQDSEIDPMRRAETLTIEEWHHLSRKVSKWSNEQDFQNGIQ